MLQRYFRIGMNTGYSVTPVIHVNQYDHDEQWIFTLVDETGAVYTPSTGGIVGLKSDGNVIVNAGTVNSSGQVVINETQQMTAAAGDAIYELLLDNSTHGSANFIVRVEPKPGDNASMSASDLSLLQEAIDSTNPEHIADSVQDWMNDNLAPSQWVIDNTLSISGAAADAKKTGDGLNELKTAKTPFPVNPYSKYGTSGQVLRTKGDGTTEWASIGQPTDAQTAEAVTTWLNNHPEATTTVQDHSLTYVKLVNGTLGYVTPEMFGARGDGVTDDTAAVQSALNSGFDVCLPSGKEYICDSLELNNVSNINISGSGILKRKDNASNNSILTINNCSNIFIEEISTDGNIENNGVTVNENQQSITVKNSENVHIGAIFDKNPSGDTLYINRVSKMYIESIVSLSDSYTGRNALSIINGDNIFVNNLVSIKTGYSTMPGGIDIEPNESTDVIKHVTINNAFILTDGRYGFSISNAARQAVITDITINNCYIEKREKTANRSNGCVMLYFANRVHGSFICKQSGSNLSQLDDGVRLGRISNSEIKIDTSNAARGLFAEGTLVNNAITAVINDTYQNAIQINNTAESVNNMLNVLIGDFAKSGSGAGVMVSSGSKAYGITFSGDLSKKLSGGQCLRFEGEIGNLIADSLDMTGWTVSNKVYGANAGNGGFIGMNCKNYNYLSAPPSGYDGYAKGTLVYNTDPAANGYIGWVCVASGKPGTWKGFGLIQE